MPGVPPEHSSKLGKEGLMRRLLSRRRITESGCWEYTGATNNQGYGRIRFKGVKTRLVSRVAAWIWLGFDPDSDLNICHHCDNPLCFNPIHLFPGTQRDNARDAANKGRFANNGKWQKPKTHCKNGHEFTPENTGLKHGTRYCIACARAGTKRWYAANGNEWNRRWRERKRRNKGD